MRNYPAVVIILYIFSSRIIRFKHNVKYYYLLDILSTSTATSMNSRGPLADSHSMRDRGASVASRIASSTPTGFSFAASLPIDGLTAGDPGSQWTVPALAFAEFER